MTKCPLVKSHKKSSPRLPKANGRALATLFAFGMGVLMATSASWRLDAQQALIQAQTAQAAAERAALEAELASPDFDSTPFRMPILADNR